MKQLILLMASILIPSITVAQSNAVDSDELEARTVINDKTEKWAQAQKEGAVAEIVPWLFTEDAIRVAAGREPVRGRAAIEEHARGFGTYVESSFTNEDVEVSGDLAYSWGHYEVGAEAGGEKYTGHYLKVWKRGSDGDWKIHRIMFD